VLSIRPVEDLRDDQGCWDQPTKFAPAVNGRHSDRAALEKQVGHSSRWMCPLAAGSCRSSIIICSRTLWHTSSDRLRFDPTGLAITRAPIRCTPTE
jgi:hypothetical protein